MAVEADARQGEHLAGRVWTVRLAPHGRPAAGTVKLSCSRPACPDQHFPGGAAAGRKAAVGHVNAHLAHIRAGGGPRAEAWCACRAADCAWHTPDPDAGHRGGSRPPAEAPRCGGPVVLAVYADRAGRLWRIAETCARCAAATPGCRVLDTALPPPSARTAPSGVGRTAAAPTGPQGSARGAAGQESVHDVAGQESVRGPAGECMAAVFSDHTPAPSTFLSPSPSPSPATDAPPSPAAAPAKVPPARAAAPRTKRWGKIAQRLVPYNLEPEVLRVELIELGDAFRAYQQRPEPDLTLLAELHDRKARAFSLWADISGDPSLHHEAQRAEQAAQTTRDMHANRGGPMTEQLLTRTQAASARTVLDYAAAHAPHPQAEVRLAVLMLALRAARDGTGNVTGQDLTGWLHNDAERVLQQLVDADWLRLPGTIADVMASRPEDATTFTVTALLSEQSRPFAFGKITRSRISGWAQKVLGDRKLRKKKLGTPTRLLALYTAAHTRPDGRLGHAEDDGLDLDRTAAFCTLHPGQVAEHAALLITADWLSETDTTTHRLRGRLAERVRPLGGLL
ncbi:hypothetical protein [Streptomyces rimosus]|uniref:hypothetical protein n=1 Tax=Streptomyces rimosus TaxID=1927 RepID=UPI0004C96484|nr:hypothetical protein [Streptomyces rimosus]